jgi:hypothetical protein
MHVSAELTTTLDFREQGLPDRQRLASLIFQDNRAWYFSTLSA